MPIAPAFILLDELTLSVHTGMFEQATEEWKALLDWCRFHGLDPERMPAQQVIERDLERCRVVYDEYVAPADDVQARFQLGTDGEPEIHRVHRQGETPPLPFPDIIRRHLAPKERR